MPCWWFGVLGQAAGARYHEEPLRSDISQQLHISQFRLNPAMKQKGEMII
jgi:hypothetical protein